MQPERVIRESDACGGRPPWHLKKPILNTSQSTHYCLDALVWRIDFGRAGGQAAPTFWTAPKAVRTLEGSLDPAWREVTHVAIIRVTKAQIAAANKAREAALKKDPEFRLHEELQQRLGREAAAAREEERSS